MPGEFWEFLSEMVNRFGFLAVVILVQTGLLFYVLRAYTSQEKEKSRLQDKLLELSEKRLQDAKDERDEYEELARDLEKSVDVLIKAFRKKSDSNGQEG